MSDETAPRRAVMRRSLGLIKPFRLWIAGGVLLGFVAIGSGIGLMTVSAYLISRAALVSNVADVALAITAVRVLAISRAAFRYLERYVTHRATLRILVHLRVWFYSAIEPLAPARLDHHRAGDLLARIVRDVDTLEDLYIRVAVPPLVAVLVTLFATLLMGAFEPILGLTLLAFMLLVGIALPLTSRRITRSPSAAVITARAHLDATLVDGVQGIAELLVFDQSGRHVEQERTLGRALASAQERLALMRGVATGMGALFASLAGITLLGMAIPLVTDGRLDGVFLALVPLAAIASFEAVQPLTQALQQLDSSQAAAERLFELIDAPAEVVDPVEVTPIGGADGISVRGLRFRYGPAEPLVLDGLDLELPPGGSLGLVGPSGSGKSTLVDLLLRFREFGEGEILLGGKDLRSYAADDVRGVIAVVSQRVDLFDATIRDNLAVADAELTDEQMIAASEMVDLHATISALPRGYDTRIGENGVRLSGGERQRLAIARAVIKDAPILILDEATANLDTETEQRILDRIAEFMAERTTLLITHRPSVAARTDRILTLR